VVVTGCRLVTEETSEGGSTFVIYWDSSDERLTQEVTACYQNVSPADPQVDNFVAAFSDQECALDVVDDGFKVGFGFQAKPGFMFDRLKKAQGYLFGGSKQQRLTVDTSGANEDLLEFFRGSQRDFPLLPLFQENRARDAIGYSSDICAPGQLLAQGTLVYEETAISSQGQQLAEDRLSLVESAELKAAADASRFIESTLRERRDLYFRPIVPGELLAAAFGEVTYRQLLSPEANRAPSSAPVRVENLVALETLSRFTRIAAADGNTETTLIIYDDPLITPFGLNLDFPDFVQKGRGRRGQAIGGGFVERNAVPLEDFSFVNTWRFSGIGATVNSEGVTVLTCDFSLLEEISDPSGQRLTFRSNIRYLASDTVSGKEAWFEDTDVSPGDRSALVDSAYFHVDPEDAFFESIFGPSLDDLQGRLQSIREASGVSRTAAGHYVLQSQQYAGGETRRPFGRMRIDPDDVGF
jgi:hypothetical protein